LKGFSFIADVILNSRKSIELMGVYLSWREFPLYFLIYSMIEMTEKCIICEKKAEYKDNTGYYCGKHWKKKR
jgi:hypothetical protein